MSRRFVEQGGRVYPRSLWEPLPPNPSACWRCEGTGTLIETWDDDRYDVVVPCDTCRTKCQACGKWVPKTEHTCAPGTKP